MPKANKQRQLTKKEAKQQSPIVPDEIQKVIQNLDEEDITYLKNKFITYLHKYFYSYCYQTF